MLFFSIRFKNHWKFYIKLFLYACEIISYLLFHCKTFLFLFNATCGFNQIWFDLTPNNLCLTHDKLVWLNFKSRYAWDSFNFVHFLYTERHLVYLPAALNQTSPPSSSRYHWENGYKYCLSTQKHIDNIKVEEKWLNPDLRS